MRGTVAAFLCAIIAQPISYMTLCLRPIGGQAYGQLHCALKEAQIKDAVENAFNQEGRECADVMGSA